jgi:Protein of unknown function (DUF2637)
MGAQRNVACHRPPNVRFSHEWLPLNGYRTTPSRRGFRIVALTAAIIGVLALAAAAFVLSYTGMRETVLHAGVTPHLARIYPAIFDAVVVVAGVTALSLPRNRGWLRSYAWLAMLIAIAGVAAADALHATATVLPKRPTELAVAIAPWVLLLIIFTLLFALVRVALPGRKAADQAQAAANGHVAADADPAEAAVVEHASNGTVPLNELLSTRAKPGQDKDAASLTQSGAGKTGTGTIENAQATPAPVDDTLTEPAKAELAKAEPARTEPAKGGRIRRGRAKRGAVAPEPVTPDADKPSADEPSAGSPGPDDTSPDTTSPDKADTTGPGKADSGKADSGQAKADEPIQDTSAAPDTLPAAAAVTSAGAGAAAGAAAPATTRPDATGTTAPAPTTPGSAEAASSGTTPGPTEAASTKASGGTISTGPATAPTDATPETASFAATSPYTAATTTAEAPLLTPPIRPERDEPSDADAEPAPNFTRLRSTPTPPGD